MVNIIYKRCTTCKSIFPQSIFDGAKYDRFGNKRIYVRKCPYCGTHEDLGTFEIGRVTFTNIMLDRKD